MTASLTFYFCRFYAEITSWYDVDKEKSYCFKNKQDSNWIGVRYGSVFPFPVGRSERIIPFPTSGPLNPLPQDEREEEIFAKKRVLEQADEYFEEMKKETEEKREEREVMMMMMIMIMIIMMMIMMMMMPGGLGRGRDVRG